MKKVYLIIVLVLYAINANAGVVVYSETIKVHNSYLNGEKFLKLSELEKVAYSMGIIDGFLASPMFGANKKYTEWLPPCISSKTGTQLSAIFSKYLKENPERWHLNAHMLFFEVMVQTCSKEVI